MKSYKLFILIKHLLMLIIVLTGLKGYSQIGLGMGTKGICFKLSSTKNKLGFIMRDGINIKNANYITNVVFSHELVGLKKIILHERSSFYLGIGIGGNLFYQSSLGNPKDGNTYQHNYNIKLPLGVELFLSKAHNVSVGIESRIETQFDFQTLYDPYLPGTYEVNFSGLMEITYYFSKKEVKN